MTNLTYARIRRQQRKDWYVVQFKPVDWQPQVEVTFTQDVNGWTDRDQGIKWHFAAGSTHMVDEQHAVEFITKGYALGILPRAVSENEAADIRSVMHTIGANQTPQDRNGGAP